MQQNACNMQQNALNMQHNALNMQQNTCIGSSIEPAARSRVHRCMHDRTPFAQHDDEAVLHCTALHGMAGHGRAVQGMARHGPEGRDA
jgi:hypothetical protein